MTREISMSPTDLQTTKDACPKSWERYEASLWGAGNVLVLDLGVSYQMGSIYEKSLSHTL